MNLTRLPCSVEVDALTGQATASASVSVADLQAAAAAEGWTYGIDLASRASATVGGTVATNAGGIHVLRHGDTRRQVLGVTAVLGDGSVVSHTGGLEKDNTGYDLAGLICGSEGTLGVVTEARLRLVRPAARRVAALVGFTSTSHAVTAAHTIRGTVRDLDAAEFFLRQGAALVCESFGLSLPDLGDAAAFVLFEAASDDDPLRGFGEAVDSLAGVTGVAVAEDETSRNRLWSYRELHTDAINRLGKPHKFDVTLPAEALASFVAEIPERIAAVCPGAGVWLFGHAADGNVHVNVTGLDAADETVAAVVLAFVADLKGSISAEHGIGTVKKRWLHLVRSDEEITAFRKIKRALDPRGVLNPNVLLPDPR